ncbi:MAG TPA: transglycosylase domain-containing protein [Candidatus Limnocylindrales bacterium]
MRARTVPAPRRAVDPLGIVAQLGAILLFALTGIAAVAAFVVVGGYAVLSVGLADPATLTATHLPSESVVYDRTGTVILARFGTVHRQVVTFDQIAPILIDATTAVEDKTFWTNAGYDAPAIVSALLDTVKGDTRGASTITQQLVRSRLLDPALVGDPNRVVERKLKEIIESARVTAAYPGVEGKREIITAYLNTAFYGNDDYGVMSAARDYFGVDDVRKLTLAQAAILAAIPQSPSDFDLVRNAVRRKDGKLVVPADSPIVQRRNMILGLMAGGRTPLTGGLYSAADFARAAREPVILARQVEHRWLAPHFVWAVRDELAARLCGATASTCAALDQGGLRIVTTLDMRLQALAEKWVKAATIVPNANDPAVTAKHLGLTYQPWMAKIRGHRLGNGALVAMDYQTGDILAYVGSADYYAPATSSILQPKFDVAGHGWRQAGSAFKPFTYVTAIQDQRITAATMIMDVHTDFGGGYVPHDADNLERGPLIATNALRFSLNVPAIKTLAVTGVQRVFSVAAAAGMRFMGPKPTAGLSLTLGTQEVHPVDLVNAYGTLADGGTYVPHRGILSVTDASGRVLLGPGGTPAAGSAATGSAASAAATGSAAGARPAAGRRVVSPQAAYIVTTMLQGNTDPAQNPFWGAFELTSAGQRRPATLKTGTNDQATDLNAYGYIAPPTPAGRAAGAHALVVGVWNGNSDASLVSTPKDPLFSIDVSTYVWQGFMLEATKAWPITGFRPPSSGLVMRLVDPRTGLIATSGPSINLPFLAGTQPTMTVDQLNACGISAFDTIGIENAFPSWIAADQDWLARAAQGPGVAASNLKPQEKPTRTSYFYAPYYQPYGASWSPIAPCGPRPFIINIPGLPPIDIPPPFGGGGGNGNGHGHGHGGGGGG